MPKNCWISIEDIIKVEKASLNYWSYLFLRTQNENQNLRPNLHIWKIPGTTSCAINWIFPGTVRLIDGNTTLSISEIPINRSRTSASYLHSQEVISWIPLLGAKFQIRKSLLSAKSVGVFSVFVTLLVFNYKIYEKFLKYIEYKSKRKSTLFWYQSE